MAPFFLALVLPLILDRSLTETGARGSEMIVVREKLELLDGKMSPKSKKPNGIRLRAQHWKSTGLSASRGVLLICWSAIPARPAPRNHRKSALDYPHAPASYQYPKQSHGTD